MTTAPARTGHTLTLTDEERAELMHLVVRSLGEVRIERRHTDVLSYQDEVRREESVLRTLLEKLRCAGR
jgi:hypothetical protein